MPCLATLEGENDGEILDRLFDCNDEIGVVIYGPDTWNKVKNFVANLATKVIAENRGNFGRWSDRNCRVNKDSIDCALGFNNQLGTALLGGEEWGRFVGRCKTAAKPALLGSVWDRIKDSISASVDPRKNIEWASGQLVPDDFSAEGLVKFATGYQQAKSGWQATQDVTGQTAKEEREREAKELERREAQQRVIENAQKVLQESQKRASAQKQLELEALKAEAEAKAAANTPEALQAKSQNLFIMGALGLAAVALLAGRKN